MHKLNFTQLKGIALGLIGIAFGCLLMNLIIPIDIMEVFTLSVALQALIKAEVNNGQHN